MNNFVSAIHEKVFSLKQKLKHIACLESVSGLLEWDQQVFMPKGGENLRSSQTAALSGIIHREKIDPKLGDLIHEITNSKQDLSRLDQVVVDDAKKSYLRNVNIPSEFAIRKAEKQSLAYQKWVDAREANDYAAFAPCLKEQVELCKEEAAYVGSHESAYEFWLDTCDPGLDVQTVESLFNPLGEAIAEMVPALVEAQKGKQRVETGGFDIQKQKTFSKQVVKRIGFDFNHGRIDESVHPFCSGDGQDIRMTTRYFENNPLDSLYSSIHEAGHAMYEQGLPSAEFGNALGQYVGMAIHESQSRLWENQVARSEAFWSYWEPQYREMFTDVMQDITHDQWMSKILEVQPIPVRVDSDEVTYNLHIIIRFQLEKALFDGDLSIEDLPAAWNDAYEKYLGIRPNSDKEGVLQDVHWASGAFGYFPSYTIGTIISAQLWDSIKVAVPNVEQLIRTGEYQLILDWLRTHVHAKGKQYSTQQLVEVATGKSISEQPLVQYLKEKYFGYFGVSL